MCGIIGYIGNKQALPILINGLRRLEYRGYDSAGIAVIEEEKGVRSKEKIVRVKAIGKIDELAKKVVGKDLIGTIGIAHTRWATHGGVTEVNAHPHTGCTDDLVIVHNGIIENYRELKEKYLAGHEIKSQTDTEILAHLIELFYKGDLLSAVREALSQVRGTYGLVVMHASEPNRLVAARLGSPLVIGVGEGEYYIASDTSPMLAHTRNVIFLDDGEIADIGLNKFEIFNVASEKINKDVNHIDWDEAQAQLSGFPHFMLKEIFAQPTVMQDAVRGRYNLEEGTAHLGGINMTVEEMHKVKRVILLACGTASYAAMIGKYAFERLAGISTEVDVASEFRYRDPIIDENTLVFGISQSGETADTLAALREAKRKGAFVRGIVNVVGSTIARETDGGTYIHAGPELAVASTKAYTNMAAVLLLYALQFGRLNRVSLATGQRLLTELRAIPEKMKQILEQSEKIKVLAEKYKNYKDFFFLGRGINFPVALEGSLKLKEISYIHSEAYPGGEMKHGPIALLSPDFPVFAIMTKNQLYDKMRSNVEEIKARKAPIVLIATEGDESAKELANDVIFVPPTMELIEPLLNTLPLQLFAYHTAVLLGRDVDRPRNLAKSVTVE
ncbi:MAG: Isomerizing Glutamine-fructose-6-phosphate aminotransferase [Candidatus Magasanikbacteria bacterium GW2011_GWC2_34_16]|uniref:Glutamine--fructose-6-phosphate aminotransferase [isomerizing] n=2 Tax=Candidatus Magasanikiibacteriota TaxID=1752731 RepID=A0A0G0KIS2_9BACT|nr:MAG: Isomerizing Glutamine-fructose-6-phosphate aminotransferase [Candidatus Magasanikbacteria bacterium GW2011_GWC2_34_16]KKQ40496.1 MAG: Isomerizing Glutamine-fructose-6-phosphate aminotransferase [Candidatus Magasanikbacteria bacterium GW2011_GWA2_37_8]